MRELPVIPCVRHILNSISRYRREAVRIALPWTLLTAALDIVELILYPPDTSSSAISINPMQVVAAAIGLIVTASISVNWHRYILRDEIPAANQLFRVDGHVLKYAGVLLLIILVVVIPAVIMATVALAAAPGLRFLAPLAALATALLVTRLTLALPAAALGRSDFGLGAAFKATEGNTWRLIGVLAIMAALTLGVLLAMGIILSIAQQFGLSAMLTVAILAGIPAKIFLTILSASQLNSLYGFFVEGRNF
jgi:hypothetical protein